MEQVVHCIKAKDTVIDIRKLIQDLNYEKLDVSLADDTTKSSCVLYNDAIDDAINDLKWSINPLFQSQFDFEETRYVQSDYEQDV